MRGKGGRPANERASLAGHAHPRRNICVAQWFRSCFHAARPRPLVAALRPILFLSWAPPGCAGPLAEPDAARCGRSRGFTLTVSQRGAAAFSVGSPGDGSRPTGAVEVRDVASIPAPDKAACS